MARRVIKRDSTTPTLLVIAPCYDEPKRTTGSVPKISTELSKLCRVVVFCGGSSTRVENRSPTLKIYFNKELLVPDPANVAFVPGMSAALDRVVRKEKPDAVLNVKHMFPINTLVDQLARQGFRIVTATDTFPGYNWYTTSKIGNIALWIYARLWPKRVLNRSDHVILFHSGLVPVAKKLGLRYSVIPNGVELENVRAAKPRKLAGRINVVYAGRLESVKGYETLFAAMDSVVRRDPSIHFYHVGDNAGKDAFLSKYKHPNIHSEGRVPLSQVYSYMKGADIVLLGSRSEGLPNVILEGMAAGCVPVSTPVGAVPEILEQGKLGLIVKYGDVKGFERAVMKLAHSSALRRRLSALGRAKIEASYNWEKLAKQYYDELFADSKRQAKKSR